MNTRRILVSAMTMGLALVGTACNADHSSDVDGDDAGGPGKADCVAGEACEASQQLSACAQGETEGCLRHGVNQWTPPVFVNPGWDEASPGDDYTEEQIRQRWHHQDQGTKIFPLSWILALERPIKLSSGLDLVGAFLDGIELNGLDVSVKELNLDVGPILDDRNLRKYGFFPDHNRLSNPYQLPVGFSIIGDDDADDDGQLDARLRPLADGVEQTTFGYTCAACHTQQAEIDGTVYQVAGGSGLMDFGQWNEDMVLAVVETLKFPHRRARFVRRVQALQEKLYGKALSTEEIEATLGRFSFRGFLLERIKLNRKWEPVKHGPGRVDAVARGLTTLNYDYLREFVAKEGENFSEEDRERNLGPIDGMVSLPPIYDGPKWDWAEYGHSIRQSFARNTSEAVAVNSQTHMATLEGDVNARGLLWIERYLRRLEAPTYPGKVDDAARKLGQALFWGDEEVAPRAKEVHCARCHGPREPYDGIDWKLNVVPLATMRTDPGTLLNFATRNVTLPTSVWKSWFTPRVTAALNNLLGLQLDPNRPQRVPAGLGLFALIDGLGTKLFAEQGWDWAGAPSEACRDPKNWHDEGTCEATLGRSPLFRVDIPRSTRNADGSRAPLDPMLFLPRDQDGNELGYDEVDPRCDDRAGDERTMCLQNLNWIGYRARPLHGMWLAAPYLHNNSVPNLCFLLGDPDDRPDEFYVGNIEFDAECLGYSYKKSHLVTGTPRMPDGETRSFEFEVEEAGNSNAGHMFTDDYDPQVGPRDGVIGRKLEDAEIAALVEYIKSLPPLPPGPDGRSHVDEYASERYDELK